jgi:tRNA threonylcarbamoyl adenosine modification protein YeaZ
MTRGQAERLVPLLEEVLAEGHCVWSDLSKIGVGIGPGNFTGIRISVACARGLALSLGIPAVGVSTFDAIHLSAPDALAAIAAPRDHVYLQRPDSAAEHMPHADAQTHGSLVFPPEPELLITAMAKVAQKSSETTPPAPLYIKPADAAPSRVSAPVILS